LLEVFRLIISGCYLRPLLNHGCEITR